MSWFERASSEKETPRCLRRVEKTRLACVNRFYPKMQLSWLARLDHSHCNSADPLTDRLEVFSFGLVATPIFICTLLLQLYVLRVEYG